MTVEAASSLIDGLVERANRVPALEAEVARIPGLEAQLAAALRRATSVEDAFVDRVIDGIADRSVAVHRVVLDTPFIRGSSLVAAQGATLCTSATTVAADALLALLRRAGVQAHRG